MRHAAYRIIEGKGATDYGIGGGIARIVRAIGADEGAVLTLSNLDGFGDVSLSLPRVLNASGIGTTIRPILSENEADALQKALIY